MERTLNVILLTSLFLVACSSAPFKEDLVPAEPSQAAATSKKNLKASEQSEPSPYADSTSIQGIRLAPPTPKPTSSKPEAPPEILPPTTRESDSKSNLPPPTCTIQFYPDTVPNGGGTILVWKMENAVSGSYNCRNQMIKGEVTALYGQIKVEKSPKSLFCSFIAVSASGQKEKCTASLISKPSEGNKPSCSIAFTPNEIPIGGKTILSWSSVHAQRIFYRCPDLKINAEVREEFGSRVLDKIQKPMQCEIVVTGANDTQSTCQANLTMIENSK